MRAAHWLLALLVIVASLALAPAAAHELQPGFLELKETAPGRYDVLWKLPSLGSSDTRMPIAPVFPETCRQLGEARSDRAGTAWVFTARLECKGGLAGQAIAIEGLEAFVTDVLVRVQHADESVETHVLKPMQPSVTLRAAGEAQRNAGRGLGAYLYLGIEHILLGVDHLLFVLGLLLIVRDRWMLVKTITAFTVAHSISLAAATFARDSGAGGAVERRDRAVDSVSRPRDRSRLARTDELHDPPPVGGCVRVRAVAWIWFCQRPGHTRLA